MPTPCITQARKHHRGDLPSKKKNLFSKSEQTRGSSTDGNCCDIYCIHMFVVDYPAVPKYSVLFLNQWYIILGEEMIVLTSFTLPLPMPPEYIINDKLYTRLWRFIIKHPPFMYRKHYFFTWRTIQDYFSRQQLHIRCKHYPQLYLTHFNEQHIMVFSASGLVWKVFTFNFVHGI